MDLEALRQAIEVSPDNVPLLILLAKALTDAFELDEAKATYDRVLEREPENDAAALGTARVLHLQGKTSEAIVRTEHLTRRRPEFAEAWFFLAGATLGEGQLDAARKHYERAVGLDPALKDPEFEKRLGPLARETEDEKSGPIAVDTGSWGAGAMKDDDEAFEMPGSFDNDESLKLEFMQQGDPIDFTQVGGMGEVKEDIRMKILYPLQNSELFAAYGKKAGGGVLLYGPPGCGKTLISQATAGEIKANFLSIGLHQVLDMWIGGSEEKLHGIFELARKHAPSVLFFDEIDALAADRKDLRTSAGRTLINQFLAELDGNIGSNDNVLILGATNAPWHLDSAFLRPGRFDRIVFIPPPDHEARREIAGIQAKDKPTESLDLDRIATVSKNFSGADIKAIFDRATEDALALAMKKGKLIPLSTKALVAAAKKVKPSTLKWFESAKNYALYANQSGFYDEVLGYLGMKK